jgi:hypothetical protein
MRHPISWAAIVFAFIVFAYAGPAVKGQVPTQQTNPVTTVTGTVPTPAPGVSTQAAVVTTTVPSPASPTHVPEQVMWGLAMSYVMRYLTQKGWLSFLTPQSTARVKTICGFLVAAATAAGIHFAVSGTLVDGGGVSFSVTGISLDAVKDIGFQWVSMQAWYDGLVKKVVV